MTDNKYCVIMAGGVGTKLWPKSRRKMPKQFLDILGCGKSLLRQTYERFLPLVGSENFLVVTTLAYRDLVLEHIPELTPSQVLCEPVGRNTAPCVCYAAYRLRHENPHAEMIVTPADHYVGDKEAFLEAVRESLEFATSRASIAILGVKPTHPEPRYGYVQISDDEAISRMKCFTEKPTIEVAEHFVQSKEFYWNTGLFVVRAADMISRIERYLPQHYALFNSITPALGTADEQRAIEQIYSECRQISIDQGVMERADDIYIKRCDFAWSDVGTWGAIHQHSQKDNRANVTSPSVFTFNTHNSYISTSGDKIAVVSGMDSFIIIDTEDLLMVCPRSEEQEIKRFIDEVKFYKNKSNMKR